MAMQKSLANALDMLPHLARCAKERRTITYSELGASIGIPAYFLGQSLDFLRDQILPKHNLPRLDALVVNKETREAGDSFYEGGREGISKEDYHDLLESERQRVFDRDDWDALVRRLQLHYGDSDYIRSRGLANQ